ncbi:MAG: FAD/FMN-containing dehydrogenases [uncultured Nocardioidaceae bacterium]|uniref:Delta(24)-sterol reductase n=1 Tax=uncultured Nocardioidaceae bacterium TaxID=253824 RepID=A0A6J4N4U9_9ACTN|nr:MAG: FAD/FMN-containing dehydrogenases [uncultured Nocardioidaceae bacterium]
MRPAEAHDDAVAALQASYAALAPGSQARLAKRSSNLFRPRGAPSSPGLDVTRLDGVLSVDADARTADVQGMCTYEHLVDATLGHGLMPLVVPQLKTITLGGAVTGLGIESSSFQHGLPHESVLEMDVLTGDGRVVTASPHNHADLYRAFPNSYGSLGYAVRLRIELQPVGRYVALRHVRFTDLAEVAAAVESITAKREWDGEQVDFVDGVVFEPAEAYLTLGRFVDRVADSGLLATSDYTDRQIYYRSLRERSRDVLTVRDYLWRWDTDWFWCSRAFGAQHPVVRRWWPARYRRSDVYHRIVAWENRFGALRRVEAWRGRPARERVVQDVEIPVDRTASFLHWFDAHVGMRPVWLCPLRLRTPDGPGTATHWPLYPLRPDLTYVNVGFWGTVAIAPGRADGDVNADIEAAVASHGGHKSLYSDAYYDEDRFYAIYGGSTYHAVKSKYDPDHRLTELYDKAVRRR